MCMKCWAPSYQQLCWSSLTEVSVISLFFVGNVQCADKVPEKTLNLVDLIDLFIGDHTILNLTCIIRFMKRTLIVTPCLFLLLRCSRAFQGGHCILLLWHVSSAQRVNEFSQLQQCFYIKMRLKKYTKSLPPPPKEIWQTCIFNVQMKSSLLYLFYMYFSISNSRSFISMDSFKLNDPIDQCVTRPPMRGPTWRVALHVAAVLLLWSQPRVSPGQGTMKRTIIPQGRP